MDDDKILCPHCNAMSTTKQVRNYEMICWYCNACGSLVDEDWIEDGDGYDD